MDASLDMVGRGLVQPADTRHWRLIDRNNKLISEVMISNLLIPGQEGIPLSKGQFDASHRLNAKINSSPDSMKVKHGKERGRRQG